MTKKCLVCVLFGLLIACSDNDSASKDTAEKATVFDSQINALEKAKSVDQQVQEAAENARKSIEDNGG